MEYICKVEDAELGKVEMWELKNESVEAWNDRKDDRTLLEEDKIKIGVVHSLFTDFMELSVPL